MSNSRTPLLADDGRDSDRSDDRAAEEDAALHGRTNVPATSRRWLTTGKLRETVLFTWALLATAAVIVLAVVFQHSNHTPATSPSTTPKRNLIFMVSDGMGPASLSLTRSFRQHVEGLPINDTLTLDRHFWGSSRTRSSSSLVTDSAAGATAFSCGRKSYNGAISVLPDYTPCGTVLEAAKRGGYTTGMVVTTDVTDATPACFASHLLQRSQMDEAALQEVGEGPLGRVVDLVLGGGRCHFLPNSSSDGCRSDDVDVTRLARERHGWNYVHDRAGFDALRMGDNVTLPTLGLFAYYNIPYEVDRRAMADRYPSLSEMAVTALRALDAATKDSEQGFFLMIEGSRIDHAGHSNDPAAQVREVLEYDKAFKAVVDFLDESDTEGVLVATSDHETGGLALALQTPGEDPVYQWYPEQLARANTSCEQVTRLLLAHVAAYPDETVEQLGRFVNGSLVNALLGIDDASAEELAAVVAAAVADSDSTVVTQLLARIVSLRARIGWATHGHTAVDVNVYGAGGAAVDRLRGNVENTDIGVFLADYLGVDTAAVTHELREKMKLRPPTLSLAEVEAASARAADVWLRETRL